MHQQSPFSNKQEGTKAEIAADTEAMKNARVAANTAAVEAENAAVSTVRGRVGYFLEYITLLQEKEFPALPFEYDRFVDLLSEIVAAERGPTVPRAMVQAVRWFRRRLGFAGNLYDPENQNIVTEALRARSRPPRRAFAIHPEDCGKMERQLEREVLSWSDATPPRVILEAVQA